MKKIWYFFIFAFITSCNNFDFVYNDNKNLINPLYEKTEVITSGVDLVFINSYTPMFFGQNKQDEYKLIINIDEIKTKRSIETNQATSNLRYELRFFYTLLLNQQNCIVYEKEILSSFSIIPKSAGYNYGTDTSLEKKYELAITQNFNQLISFLSRLDINKCK